MLTMDELEQHLLDIAQQIPRNAFQEPEWVDMPKVAAQAPPKLSNEIRDVVKQHLEDPFTTATGCFKAMDKLFGPQFRSWEPETLWLSLDANGIDIPLINRDKILASVTLLMVPAFWWEVNAFENTTMAFNNVVSDHRVLQEATPAQICWAVYESQLLYNMGLDVDEQPEFDREPIGYTAIVLNRAGFVLAPDLLQFAQEDLDKLNRGGSNISVGDVRHAWKNLKKSHLEDRDFSDSALDLQLARLSATQLYIKERLKQYTADLTQF